MKVGKIDLDTFEKFIMHRLGAKNSRVLVPPLTGVDAGVIKLDGDQVLVIAEDPIFQVPGQRTELFGWYTVHIGASDVAVMGVKPQFMTYTLLMPPETEHGEMEVIIDSIHKTAKELGIAIVGGHTGFYPAVTAPLIGGITVFGICGKDEYVSPMGAKPGNKVIATKGPAIEATGILASLYEKELLKKGTPELVESAKGFWSQMTVVRDALVAKACGGVTAMHDATEGGVMAGLFEIASASGVGMNTTETELVYPEEARLVCETLGLDPLKSISEGTLLITCEDGSEDAIIENLLREGITASVIGEVTDRPGTRNMSRVDGREEALAIPDQDPFWPVFFKAFEK